MSTKKRTKALLIRLHEHEHQMLSKKANELNTNKAELIRQNILNLIANEKNHISKI